MANLTLTQILGASVALLISIVIAIAARNILVRIVDHGDASRSMGRLTGRFVALVVVVVGVVYALGLVGVRITPLLGALGVGGIAIAFALQDILQNFVAGVLLQVRRPFKIGDQVDSNAFEGVIRDVNLRTTEIHTFDGLTVYLPNAVVLKAAIVNHTRTPVSRTTLDVGVPYDTDLRTAQRVLLESCAGAPGVETAPPPEVWCEEFGDSSINFAVRYWHRADMASRWRVRHEVALAVKDGLDAVGIAIPFPQRTLWWGREEPQPD